ncbi:DUF4303 domain-containing protein [Pedobacter agri]|uniref:DUF4303 domain-containing protein n=1 Tax=Pedobacter agri TaxID=454586 RepID=UPI00292F8D3A|nr:DUF4303 domain-containing protein [Pedobacter agri]
MKNNFDYTFFEQSLSQATKKIIQKLVKKYGEKNLRAFCLYSDEDAGSSVFSFDTYKNYEEQTSENDESEADYYKWYFGEWLDDDTLSNDLNQISETLFGAEYGKTTEDFVKHKYKIYEIFVSVLSNLKSEEVFKEFNNDFVLAFGISDFENKELELNWMKKLNSEKVFNEFKAYRETF